MKTIYKITLGSALLLLSGLPACTPEATENPQPDFLTGGLSKTWQMTDARQYIDGDWLSVPDKSCLVGDLYTFKADKAFAFDEGVEKCSSTTPQTVTGQWELNNSTITMKETTNKAFVVLKIQSLNATKMVTQVDNNGGSAIEYTFTAK